MTTKRSAVGTLARLIALAGLLAINYSTPARAVSECTTCITCPGHPEDACCDSGNKFEWCVPQGGGCSVGADCPPF